MPFFLRDDEDAMRGALAEAARALDEGEVPVGCVIVHDGIIVGRGHNQVERLHDATAHAEIVAIGAASTTLGSWRLSECTLYVTLEPCAMCAGAIVLARVGRVVYGALDPKAGACGSVLSCSTSRGSTTSRRSPRACSRTRPARCSASSSRSSGARPRTRSIGAESPWRGTSTSNSRPAAPIPRACAACSTRRGAEFRGLDRQRDVYYRVAEGRLKLRRGTIERSLMHYRRADTADVKRSEVTLARLEALAPAELDAHRGRARRRASACATVVEKAREIRFVGNVKFHLDEVPGLGAFVEIEAIDLDGSRGEAALRAQCERVATCASPSPKRTCWPIRTPT